MIRMGSPVIRRSIGFLSDVHVTEVGGKRVVQMDGGKKVDAEVVSVKLLGELHFRIEY